MSYSINTVKMRIMALHSSHLEQTVMKVPANVVVFPSNTIRIVCISDTHGEDPSLRIPPGDILIHAGDLTDPGSLLELERAYQWISKMSHPVKVVVAGNHDVSLDSTHPSFRKEAVDLFTSPQALSHGIHYLDRQVRTVAYFSETREPGKKTLQPLNIYGNPLQPDFLDTDYAFTYAPWPSSAATQAWQDAPDSAARVPIWVMHGPPKDRLDWIDIDRLEGCVAQARAIASSRPLLCVFGHYHVSNGVERVKWRADGDGVAASKVLSKPTHAPAYDFSSKGREPPLHSGNDTVFVNAAWMTGRKREVADRYDPVIVTISFETPNTW